MPTQFGWARLQNDLTTFAEVPDAINRAQDKAAKLPNRCPRPILTLHRRTSRSGSAGSDADRNRPRPRLGVFFPSLGIAEEQFTFGVRDNAGVQYAFSRTRTTTRTRTIGARRGAPYAVASTDALNALNSSADNSIDPALALAIACSPFRAPTSA